MHIVDQGTWDHPSTEELFPSKEKCPRPLPHAHSLPAALLPDNLSRAGLTSKGYPKQYDALTVIYKCISMQLPPSSLTAATVPLRSH